METVAAEKRFTWEQIREKYPDQWVALEDVEYLDDDGVNVKSAVVICGVGRRLCSAAAEIYKRR